MPAEIFDGYVRLYARNKTVFYLCDYCFDDTFTTENEDEMKKHVEKAHKSFQMRSRH